VVETAAQIDPVLIGQLQLFRSVNLESIQGIFDFCSLRSVEAGEVVLSPGEYNRTVFFILQGRLSIHLDSLESEPLIVLGPGENVGELSVIDQHLTTAYVVADEPCQLMLIDEDILWSLVQSSHAIACNLLYTMTRRLRQTNAIVSKGICIDREERPYGNVDALTGLPNREWLCELLKRQCQRSSTDGQPLSLILIDIDNFSEFINTNGHRLGDRIVYAMSYTLKNLLRPVEIVSRFRNDQFAVLLPDIDIDRARNIAVRLFRAFENVSPLVVDDRVIHHPTISVGLAQMKPGQDAYSFLLDVDAAVFRAKQAGGNTVSG
jgi:diguanylate cyclase (GGDEF)-like protein